MCNMDIESAANGKITNNCSYCNSDQRQENFPNFKTDVSISQSHSCTPMHRERDNGNRTEIATDAFKKDSQNGIQNYSAGSQLPLDENDSMRMERNLGACPLTPKRQQRRGRSELQKLFDDTFNVPCSTSAEDFSEFEILTIKEELTAEEGLEVGRLESMIKEEADDLSQGQHLSYMADFRVVSNALGRRRGRGRGRGRGGSQGRGCRRGRGGNKRSAGEGRGRGIHLMYNDDENIEAVEDISMMSMKEETQCSDSRRNGKLDFTAESSTMVQQRVGRRGRPRGRRGQQGRGRNSKDGEVYGIGRRSSCVRNIETGKDTGQDDMKEEDEDTDDEANAGSANHKTRVTLKPGSQRKPKTFQCTHCTKLFTTQANLSHHARWMHSADRPLSQPSLWFFQTQCHTVAHAVAALTGTVGNSGDKTLIHVQHRFSDQQALEKFTDQKNDNQKNQILCQICNKVFRTYYSLLVHSRIHTGEKLFSCDYCDQKFITSGHLARHHRTHAEETENSFTKEDFVENDDQSCCLTEDNASVPLNGRLLTDSDSEMTEVCSITIPDASSDDDNPVSPANMQCDVTHCKESSPHIEIQIKDDACAKQDNKYKARTVRADKKDGLVKRKPLFGVIKNKIQCQVCGKAFTTKYSLLIHSRIHTGEKPYSCDVCNQRFYTSSHLVTHKRTHTGEKPYRCKDCGKSFSSSNPLRRHEQSFHSSLRPYVCEFCAKTFKFKDNLRLHIARRHSGKKHIKCSFCDLMFADRKQARRHERVKHKTKPVGYEEMPDKQYRCSSCGLTFTDLEQIKQHKLDAHEADIDQTPAHTFKCNICNKAYVWRGGLREHMLKHGGERRFECHICNKKFFSREVLRRHSITHTDIRPFSCTVCDKRFKSKGVMAKHAVRFHFGEKQFSCEVCGKQFFTATELKTHKAFHTDEKLFICEVCNARLKTQMSLKRHMISHGERKFSCETCGKQFFTELHMKRHQMIHTGERPFNCYLCNRQFHTKKNLGRHMASHGEKKHSCETCHKKFFNEMDKTIHEAFHLGKKPFDCHLCSRSFNAKKTLKCHLSHHDDENCFTCQFCGQIYPSPAELDSHERIHTGEKPYECAVCDEKFRVKVNLKRHLNMHGGEKQHECKLCGKKFLLGQYLRQHMKSHTGMKPYTCCTCNKQYAWRRDLMIHYRKCQAVLGIPEESESRQTMETT